jgi:hypothetical protein
MHRVPECQSLRRKWVPLLPPPQASVSPPQDPSREETLSLAGEGVVEPSSDEGSEILLLYVGCSPSTSNIYVLLLSGDRG